MGLIKDIFSSIKPPADIIQSKSGFDLGGMAANPTPETPIIIISTRDPCDC